MDLGVKAVLKTWEEPVPVCTKGIGVYGKVVGHGPMDTLSLPIGRPRRVLSVGSVRNCGVPVRRVRTPPARMFGPPSDVRRSLAYSSLTAMIIE